MIDLPPTLPLQRDDWTCGQTAARAVYRCLGVRKANQDHPKGSPIDGTDPREIERAFRASGLLVQSGTMTPADLTHHTRHKRPVVCLVTEPGGVGHYVVVGGVRRGRVYYHCPGAGPKAESVAQFVARWHDVDRTTQRYEQWGIAVWPAG